MSATQYKSLETKMDATQAQLEAAKDSQLSETQGALSRLSVYSEVLFLAFDLI